MQDRSEVRERGGSGTDRRRANQDIFNGIPEGAGPRVITGRGGAVHCVRPPGSLTFAVQDHFVGVTLAPSLGVQASLGGDNVHEYDADTGSIVIIPANVEAQVTWSLTRETVVVGHAPESLLELAAHEYGTDHVELLPPPLGTVDLHALQLAQLLKGELTQRDVPSELYVDSLVTMFGVHILRNYAGAGKLPQSPKGGLSNRGARKVREFLRVNFSTKVSVAELAAVSGLSPRHFIQAFTKSFGEPPHKYLLRLRLDFAEKLLFEGDLPIAEVAHLSGFSDQSHLTATMSKYRGRTPRQVRLQR